MTRRRLVKLVSVVQHPQVVKLCRGFRHRHDCIGVTIDNRKDEIFHHGQKPVKLFEHGYFQLSMPIVCPKTVIASASSPQT